MILRTVTAPLAGLLFGLSLGCTAILDGKNDDVERCDNVDDCSDPEDARFFAQCIKEDNDIPGVCVSAFKEDVACDGNAIAMSSPNSAFAQIWMDLATAGRYTDGCDEAGNEGKQGCPGPCMGGLTENALGVCDDDDPSTPVAVPADPAHVGDDIEDQFCRSFFCDETFACRNGVCAQCDAADDVGEGGCGNLYMNGAPSCVYTGAAALDSECAAPTSNRESVKFGDCPMP